MATDLAAGRIERRPPFGSNPLVGERGTDTRRRILEAALSVFGEVGFHEARVELITARAGCSRPAFYQYFSSKDDVFWTLASDVGRDMVELAGQLGPVGPTAEGMARLTSWIDDFIGLYRSAAPVFGAFQAASRDHADLVRNSRGTSDRTAEALLRGFGVRRSRRSTALARATVAVLIRCSFYADAFAPAGLDRARLVDSLARMIHRSFVGPVRGVNTEPERARRRARGATRLPARVPVDGVDASRRPRGERTRQQLLRAGASVLPARGYHDARVDDIVAAANVSHGTFYRYFSNKEDFFKVLAQQASGELIALLDDLADSGVGDVDVLRTWLASWFAAYRSNGGVISTWQEMRTDVALVAFSQEVAAAVVDRLVLLLGDRSFGDPEIDAFPLLALLERMPYSVFTLGFANQTEATEAMVTILRQGLFALDGAR